MTLRLGAARLAVVLCLALGLAPLSVQPALGFNEAASDWSIGHYSRARLVSGATLNAAGEMQRLAGVELRLDDGWKTYWRSASGSGGFPPVFSWEGSVNLKSVRVLYPAPKRYVGKEETTIGYKHELVFPLEVIAIDPKQPVQLKLRMDYGVCTDFCVPAEADLELNLPVRLGGAGLAPLIARYLDRVPGSPEIGSDDPAVERVQVAGVEQKPALRIDTRFAADAQDRDVFIEAADGTFVPHADPVEQAGNGQAVYEVKLRSQADLEALRATDLIITLVSSAGQSETRLRLDN